MRVLTVDGAYFRKPLERMGCKVLSIGVDHDADLVLDKVLSASKLLEFLDSRGFRPDLTVWCDMCRPPMAAGLESLPGLVFCLSIDSYCNPWHVPYSGGFDAVFVSQKDYMALFELGHIPRPVIWLPPFCNTDRDRDPGLDRDIPVSFVGTLDPPLNSGRKPFLEEFGRTLDLHMTTGDFRPVFNRSRLVLNQTAVGELNNRIFESMACGAALLTEDCDNGLAELFEPGRDLMVYPRGNARAAARIARAALDDPEGLAAMARAGRRLARNRNSAQARARQVLDKALEMQAAGGGRNRPANASLVRREVARAYFMLAEDMELPLPRAQRAFYRELAARLDSA